jgi:prepilin-type processing-associated H-X9-DG protein
MGVDQLINSAVNGEIASRHPGGAIIAFAGGQSKFVDQGVALPILGRLAIRDDGEVLTDEEY